MNRSLYIVTGLPRSGTSLMMQMLSEIGISIIASNSREIDKHNPRGYFEDNRVNSDSGDLSFLDTDCEAAVKITIPRIESIPKQSNARVIFMTRNTRSIAQSQYAFIGRQSVPIDINEVAANLDLMLLSTFDYLLTIYHDDLIEISYDDLLNEPERALVSLIAFLNRPNQQLDKLKAVIDPTLRHWNGKTILHDHQ